MTEDTIVIASARRTPIGAFQGALAPVAAPDLGATAAAPAIEDAGVMGDAADQRYLPVRAYAARQGGGPGGDGVVDGTGDIRLRRPGVDQGDHLRLGEDDTGGVYRHIPLREERQPSHLLHRYLQCPGHGLDEGAYSGGAFVVLGEIQHLALAVTPDAPAFLGPDVEHRPRRGQ